MNSFLKNYTSNVPVSETIHRIEQVLIRCGVSGITKEYGPTGIVSAIRFEIKTSNGCPQVVVRLPADVTKAWEALWKDYAGAEISEDGQSCWSRYKKKKKAEFYEQACRTAWKIIQDWIEVQMSMIQMQQADTVEVFMPYIWDGRQTLYHRVKDGGYAALLPERCES